MESTHLELLKADGCWLTSWLTWCSRAAAERWSNVLPRQRNFPKPVKIGKATRFSERECRQFVAERIAERDRK